MPKKTSFEKSFKKLEEIIESLEAGDLSLDEALKNYKDGVKALKECYAILESAEKKVQILIKDEEGKPHLKDFDARKKNVGKED